MHSHQLLLVALHSASVLFGLAFQCLKALMIILSFLKDSFNLQPVTVNQAYCFLAQKKPRQNPECFSGLFPDEQTNAVVHRFVYR